MCLASRVFFPPSLRLILRLLASLLSSSSAFHPHPLPRAASRRLRSDVAASTQGGETTWYLAMWCMQMIPLSRPLILIWQRSELSGRLYIGNQICDCQLRGRKKKWNVCVCFRQVHVHIGDQARQSETGNRWRHAREREREREGRERAARRQEWYKRATARWLWLRKSEGVIPGLSLTPHSLSLSTLVFRHCLCCLVELSLSRTPLRLE